MKVIVITGASDGIGAEMARQWAARDRSGLALVLAARSVDKLETVAAACRALGAHVLVQRCDVGVQADCIALTDAAIKAFGRIDTLVNNAAALIRLKLVDFTEELLQKAVRWNVWNTLRCCKAVLPHMIERQYGRIVNIGGEAWRTGAPYHTLLAGIGTRVVHSREFGGAVATHWVTPPPDAPARSCSPTERIRSGVPCADNDAGRPWFRPRPPVPGGHHNPWRGNRRSL